MAITTRPYDGNAVAGDDGPYTSQQWRNVWHNLHGNDNNATTSGDDRGVLFGVEGNLRVTPRGTPDRSVDVAAGAALIQGMWFENDASANLAVGTNASGLTRYDVVYAQYNATAGVNTGALGVLAGTPGAGVPSLTQNKAAVYQIPLAVLELISGYATITEDEIFDARIFANLPEAVAIRVQNTSAQALQGGDVAVWDSGNDEAVTTSTTRSASVAGVIEGYIPINGWGRVIVQGLAYVRTGAAITRGDSLRHSTTATEAEAGDDFSSFARAIETTAGAGLVLSHVNAPPVPRIVTTRGDIVYRDANELQRLAIGSAGDVLTTDGTDPLWDTVFIHDPDYDSGWFSQTLATTYTKAHGLAVTPRHVIASHSAVASPGAGDEVVTIPSTDTYSSLYGCGWGSDATNIYYETNSTGVINNPRRNSNAGYIRLLAWR